MPYTENRGSYQPASFPRCTALLSQPAKPRVACILNAYSRTSHADVFVSRLLDGYRLNQAWHDPRLDTVSFYVDQFRAQQLAREQAEEHRIKIYPSVAEAIVPEGRESPSTQWP